MKLAVRGFVIRLGIAGSAAFILGALIVLPLTSLSVRVVTLMMVPVGPVFEACTGGIGDFSGSPPREFYWWLASRSAMCALPVYTIGLYLPSLLRRLVNALSRSMQFAFRDPGRATLYVVVGALAGAYLGFAAWLRYGSSGALVAYVFVGAATIAWASALARAAIADVHRLRRRHP